MKKTILKDIKASLLTKKETKTIIGGYSVGGYSSCTTFIACGGSQNRGAIAGLCSNGYSGYTSLYVYRPIPSLICRA